MENLNQLTNINDTQQLIANLVLPLLSELRELKDEVKSLKQQNSNMITKNKSLVFKKEILKIEPKILLKILDYNSHRTELELFKLYYLKNNDIHECPIDIITDKKIKYYSEDGWKMDYEGYETLDILCYNIYRTLLSINTLENIENSEKFLKNQTYLNKFLDNRYRNIVYKKIRDYLKHLKKSSTI
jgi:hypothetical protein